MLKKSSQDKTMPENNNAIPLHINQATAFIDTDALVHNAELARSLSPDSQLYCMVKANAYGHGMQGVVNALKSVTDGFGVARINEGIALREQDCQNNIVVLSELLSKTKIEQMQHYKLTPSINTDIALTENIKYCESLALNYWVKIDTGMHRLGITDISTLKSLIEKSKFCDAIITHFHSAENINNEPTNLQLKIFLEKIKPFNFSENKTKTYISASNSAYLLQQRAFLKQKYVQIIRPGIMLYGADPLEQENKISAQLKPVMTLAAPIININNLDTGESVGYNQRWTAQKPSTIATVAIGYGDGYSRQAKNGTPVLVNGFTARLVGTVSMDMIGIDITDSIAKGASITVGDHAILWGNDLPVKTVANFSNTISYELLTRITERVPRVYI